MISFTEVIILPSSSRKHSFSPLQNTSQTDGFFSMQSSHQMWTISGKWAESSASSPLLISYDELCASKDMWKKPLPIPPNAEFVTAQSRLGYRKVPSSLFSFHIHIEGRDTFTRSL